MSSALGSSSPVGVDPAGHDSLRHHGGQVEPLQVAQQPVLAERDVLDGLLDGVDPVAQPHDPHHVPGEAAGERDDVVLAPLLERDRPGQRDDRRVRPARDDPQRHVVTLVAAVGVVRHLWWVVCPQ